MTVRLLVLLFLCCPVVALGQTDSPAAGVPLEVAEFRAAHLRDVAYDLALTDMRLPDGEGLDVLRHIAEIKPFRV